ncbi:MAG: SGNH/GDSL hydrolase family protein [Clostridia bacterium]|mgnify:CR=1 FL=1|nr:SGNH/GDSL hydrolase family protein [Clostridia bacterium]MBT7122918.1 SGNH/GDSL hydrolase family protein [Clostridia bacterium]
MDENAFKVKFNFQTWLKEDIDENDYNRIGSVLNMDAGIVKSLIIGFDKSVAEQASKLDEDRVYLSQVDELLDTKVIFIGDSITSDRESFAKIIAKVFAEHSGLEFIDAGVSGWRTTEFLDDFHFKVLAHEAQIAHVMLGTNGFRRSRLSYGKCNVSPMEFEQNIGYILDALSENGTTTIISTLPPYDLNSETYDIGNWTIDTDDYEQYNRIIADSAAKHGSVLNDMRSVYAKHKAKDLLLDDGVHLNKVGQYILTEQVIKKLVKLLNK